VTLRLSTSSLEAIEGLGIGVPHYDRAALAPRILHLGVGGFHRAQPAPYTDELAEGGGDWAGFGGAVATHGRYGWVGGTGTTAHVAPSTGTIGILLTQVQMTGPTSTQLMREFGSTRSASRTCPRRLAAAVTPRRRRGVATLDWLADAVTSPSLRGDP
jgi:CubicO group peptidase (beta-lactamase class C family)